MSEKLLKSLLMGIIVFVIAVFVGYISYIVTLRYQADRIRETFSVETPYAATSDNLTENTLNADYYIARIENGNIAIYLSRDNREAFLYYLDVYIGDLPYTDIESLRSGIVLETPSALASFQEDFTS